MNMSGMPAGELRRKTRKKKERDLICSVQLLLLLPLGHNPVSSA
jgi:hypothetical protein